MGRREKRGEEERYRPSEVFAMIVAALQLLLPIVAAILAAAVAGYGLFVLLF
ncbi:MAG: hypothetical protein ACOC45_05775 [Alkalispirochaetaceae bacterium]